MIDEQRAVVTWSVSGLTVGVASTIRQGPVSEGVVFLRSTCWAFCSIVAVVITIAQYNDLIGQVANCFCSYHNYFI